MYTESVHMKWSHGVFIVSGHRLCLLGSVTESVIRKWSQEVVTGSGHKKWSHEMFTWSVHLNNSTRLQ